MLFSRPDYCQARSWQTTIFTTEQSYKRLWYMNELKVKTHANCAFLRLHFIWFIRKFPAHSIDILLAWLYNFEISPCQIRPSSVSFCRRREKLFFVSQTRCQVFVKSIRAEEEEKKNFPFVILLSVFPSVNMHSHAGELENALWIMFLTSLF